MRVERPTTPILLAVMFSICVLAFLVGCYGGRDPAVIKAYLRRLSFLAAFVMLRAVFPTYTLPLVAAFLVSVACAIQGAPCVNPG